jgi:hypothetical protein
MKILNHGRGLTSLRGSGQATSRAGDGLLIAGRMSTIPLCLSVSARPYLSGQSGWLRTRNARALCLERGTPSENDRVFRCLKAVDQDPLPG